MPSLDTVFQVFANWATGLFCLGIAITTHVIRTVVQAAWKNSKTSDLWNEVAVRVGPIGTGVLLVFVSKSFPWPKQIMGSGLGMAFYGAACGVASAYVYAAFKSWLNALAKNGFTPAQRLLKKPMPAPAPVPAHERPTDPPPAA
jgi:hypothetical protein